jgi:hypothetical protein
MGSSPTLFDVNRISVVEKYVTVLDRIPDRYTGAAYVFLSKNNLTSLQGAQRHDASPHSRTRLTFRL